MTTVSPRLRLAISIGIVGHLMAVALPPLSFQTQGVAGSSPAVALAIAPVRHFAEAIYTDRGYAFFAPDPGPSHLIQAAITTTRGEQSTTAEWMIPDLDRHWPRLLYHRHFMLSEYFHSRHRPPTPEMPPAELPSPELASSNLPSPDFPDPMRLDRQRYVRLWESIHRHLVSVHVDRSDGGEDGADTADVSVATRRIEHAVPNYAAYRDAPIPLDDPRLYRILLDAPERLPDATRGQLPPVAAESIQPPSGQSTPTSPMSPAPPTSAERQKALQPGNPR